MSDEIMNVTENVAEGITDNIADAAVEVVEKVGNDWTKYGIGAAVGALGALVVVKGVPKVVDGAKNLKSGIAEKMAAKKQKHVEKNYINAKGCDEDEE